MAAAQPTPPAPLLPRDAGASSQGVSPDGSDGETPPPSVAVPTTESVGPLALMRAVLLDAIGCLSGQGIKPSHRARVAMQARAWIARRGHDDLFSFDSICTTLEIDGERLRRMLLTTPPSRKAPEQADPEEVEGEACRLTVNFA
jgi:hypothetical protein